MAMMDDENWRLEMRKTIEGCIARLDKIMGQWRKDDVNGVKQEPENMSDSETMKNDSNLVLEENENLADKVEFEEEAEAEFEKEAESEVEFEEESKVTTKIKSGAQDFMGTETTVAYSKIQVAVEEPTEENGKLQDLGDENANSMEQVVANQTYNYEVTLQTFNVIDTCGKFERAHWMFVDNIVDVNDPYGFRLLVMGKRRHGVDVRKALLILKLVNNVVKVHRGFSVFAGVR